MAEMAKTLVEGLGGWNEIWMGFNGKGMEWNMVHDRRMVHLKTLSFLTWATFSSLAILAQKATVARRRTFLEIER